MLQIGGSISHYRIVEKLGGGGMGVVYKAEDTRLGRLVALKFLPPEMAHDLQAMERFRREAKAASALSSPHVCQIYDADDHEGGPFIAMEFLQGKTLDQCIAGRRPQIEELLDVGIQVASGLEAAHAKGIIHRDIKLVNIFVTNAGLIKILDFGLAKRIARPKEGFLSAAMTASPGLEGELETGPGCAMGTVAYMSPEQALGKNLDARTDLFSLGVVLYEIATGVLPFRGQTSTAILDEILHKSPTAPVRINPAMPDSFEHIISKALEKDPDIRYQSAKEMIADLKRLRQDSDSSRVVLPTGTGRRVTARPLVNVGAAAVALFLCVAIACLGWRLARDAEGPSPVSRPVHRQITFTGDARDPALSPDATSVAYVVGKAGEQELMLQDVRGGPAVPLFRSSEVSYPRWSPDGSEIYVSAGNPPGGFLIRRFGGEPRRICEGGYAAWSADGAQIATAFSGDPFFSILEKASGLSRKVTPAGFQWLLDLDWSPASDLLLYLTWLEDGRYAVFTIRANGSGQKKLIEEDDEVTAARWSRSGDAIYYFRRNAGTQELVRLSVDARSGKAAGRPSVLWGGIQAGDYFTISADGTRLAYERSQEHSNLLLLDIGSQQSEWLTRGTSRFREPALSPDGRWVAFTGGDTGANIYRLPLEGGPAIQLTFSDDDHFSPSWSPDGGRIAFGSNQGGEYGVWIMNADGSGQHRLEKTRLNPEGEVSWSPNRGILYHRPPGFQNCSLLDPDSEEEIPLHIRAGHIAFARYSPDGNTAAVCWTRKDAEFGLWLISLVNGSEKLLVGNQWVHPIGWSTDGRLVYAIHNDPNNVILAVRTTGGETVTAFTTPGDIFDGAITPDGRRFVCSIGESRSDLWLVERFDPSGKK